jgi:hypothetical protein
VSSISPEEFSALEERMTPLLSEDDFKFFVGAVDDELYPEYKLWCGLSNLLTSKQMLYFVAAYIRLFFIFIFIFMFFLFLFFYFGELGLRFRWI